MRNFTDKSTYHPCINNYFCLKNWPHSTYWVTMNENGRQLKSSSQYSIITQWISIWHSTDNIETNHWKTETKNWQFLTNTIWLLVANHDDKLLATAACPISFNLPLLRETLKYKPPQSSVLKRWGPFDIKWKTLSSSVK
jgi:hypothetical protein